MNVLSWSREYFRKHSPPIFAGPPGCQGYLTWLSSKRERGSCRCAVLVMPASWANVPEKTALGEKEDSLVPPSSALYYPSLWIPSIFKKLSFAFGVQIILILFCLHNPDCYHITNYSHISLQRANERDKTLAGLCDFCLSNYSNYLKNGLKL